MCYSQFCTLMLFPCSTVSSISKLFEKYMLFSGLYTGVGGRVRGGSDQPPFFDHLACTIYYIHDCNLHALYTVKASTSNSTASQITHTGYAIDMHA